MPINPLIALQSRPAAYDTNRLTKMVANPLSQQVSVNRAAAQQAKQSAFSDADLNRFKSIYQGAQEIKPFLEQGDVRTAQGLLERRIQALKTAGIDTTETQQGLQMLQQDPSGETLLQTVNNVLLAGEKLRLGQAVGQDPSAVKEYQFFDKLTPGQKQQYLKVKRSGFSAGGVQYDAAGNQIIGTGKIAEDKQAIELAGAAGKELGKSTAEAQFDLPMVEFNANNMIRNIDELLNDPGFSGVIGLKDPTGIIPGSPEQGALARLKQIQGATFLQAYQSLKGGGQITEIEGTKAENALARLSQAQSEESFRKAAEDFKREIKELAEIARKKAGKESPKTKDISSLSDDDLLNF